MSIRKHRLIGPAPDPARPVVLAAGGRKVSPSIADVPPKPAELSWRDYLVLLLTVGAEIEHALMVEYLYAAYSLGGPDVDAALVPVVRRWQNHVLTVAREEMGHLITVQNALLLLGAPVSFEREDMPWSGPFNAFPFELEPLTLRALAKYVFSEMPPRDQVGEQDRAVVDKVIALVGKDAGMRVGQIYEYIVALVEDEQRIPDSAFHPESYDAQADWDEWGRSYRPESHKPYAKQPDVPPEHSRRTSVLVPRVATRTELAAALRSIAAQG
jgi:hypothetical protein